MRAFLPLALILCLLPSGAGARADDGTSPAPAKPEPPPPAAADPPAGLPGALLLRDAVAKGLVAASGVHPGSYESVTLVLENRSADSLALDLAGSHLRNRTGNRCQRLGLGPVATLAAAVRADGHGRLLVEIGRAHV